MSGARKRAPFAVPAFLLLLASGAAADEYSFDSTAFEKKPFELGGYVEVKQEGLGLNQRGAFYELNTLDVARRATLGRTTATLQLAGKLRQGIGTFDFRTDSSLQRDQWNHFHENRIFEAAYSARPTPGITLEAGKRALKWGKGYAWNPIGFVERPKDPNDPQLAREGFVIAGADWIASPGGALKTIALTPVVVPVARHLNGDFGSRGHLNPAAKLYLLYHDVDIDFAWQGKGSRPGRFGFDFSTNLASNLEVHGEWARIRRFTRPLVDRSGHVTTEIADATSYLVGLRYLSEADTTYIAEYYRNGTGYSQEEASEFYRLVDSSLTQLQPGGSGVPIRQALSLAQGSYGRPNAGAAYLYFRAQQKDPLGIVYLSSAITALVNLQDHSYQLTPELQYTGYKNTELRMRLFLLDGGVATDFGEKQVSRKLELNARFHF